MADNELAAGSSPSTGSRLLTWKNAALVGGVITLLLFPDLVFGLIYQVLHFGIGWLELKVEHALQEALDVSRHTAQIITAWLGLGVLLAFSRWLYLKFAPRLRAFFERSVPGKDWVKRVLQRMPGLRWAFDRQPPAV